MVFEAQVPVRLASEGNAGGALGAKRGRKSKVIATLKAVLPMQSTRKTS